MPDNERDPLEAGASRVPGSDDVVGLPAGTAGGAAYIDDTPPGEEAFVPPPGRLGGTVVLGLSQSIDNSEGGVSRTFFPQIQNAFNVGDAQLGLLGGISSAARMIFGPLWAILADRFGRKRILFVVTGLWGAWTLATSFAQSWTMLLVLYSIALVGTVASEPILNGLLGSLYAPTERGKAYGTVRSVSSAVGFVLTPALGQFGSNPDGWRYAFITMGILSILSGVLILIFVKEPKRVSAADRGDLKAEAGMFSWSDAAKLFKIPTLALMAPMLLLVTSLVLFNFMSVVWARNLGYGVTNASYLFTVFSVGSTISALVGGLLADQFVRWFGHKGRIILFQIYAVLFGIVIALTMYFSSWWDPDVSPLPNRQTISTNDPNIMYYVMVFLMGLTFSIGFSGCVLPMVSNVCPRQLSATSFAVLFSLVQGAINTVYQPLLGVISDAIGDLQLSILVGCCVPYLLNAVYWFVFYKTYPQDVARQKERSDAIAAGTF